MKNVTGPLKLPVFRNKRPAVVPGRHVLSGGGLLGRRQRQRQVAVPEEFPARALLEVEAVRGPEHPRAELGYRVVARGFFPVAALAGAGAVRPLAEVQGHAAHDELRRLGGEPRVTPPTETALDVGVVVLRRRAVELGEHPRAEQAALEVLPRVVLQERPGGHVHGEPGVVLLGRPCRAGRAGSPPSPPSEPAHRPPAGGRTPKEEERPAHREPRAARSIRHSTASGEVDGFDAADRRPDCQPSLRGRLSPSHSFFIAFPIASPIR